MDTKQITPEDAIAIRKGIATGRGTFKCYDCHCHVHREYNDLREHCKVCPKARPDALQRFDDARREILYPYADTEVVLGLDTDLRIAREFLGYDAILQVNETDAAVLHWPDGKDHLPIHLNGLSSTPDGMFRIMSALECKGLQFDITSHSAKIIEMEHYSQGDSLVGYWSYPMLDGNYPQALAQCVIAMLDDNKDNKKGE